MSIFFTEAKIYFFLPSDNIRVPKTGFLATWHKLASTCDFQPCGILTCVHLGEPVRPPFKIRGSRWCSADGLALVEYSGD